MLTRVFLLQTLVAFVLLGGGGAVGAETASLEASVRSLADKLAQAISNRDAVGAARHVREDEHVVYVSDGVVIRGSEYKPTLERFYAGLKELSFKWDRSEVRAIGRNAGVFTGWARISSVDAAGKVAESRAIFTLVYARTGSEWELVTAHKTTVP